MTLPLSRARLLLLAAIGLAACSGDDFDASQVPRITVTPVVAAPLVTIGWAPEGAQQVQVYKGTVADGNATNVVWSVAASSTNSLTSPIEYGTNPPRGGTTLAPAQALVAGQPYTVQVSRVDPRNVAGSVNGSRFRYSNTQTFTLPAGALPPQ